MKQKGLRKLVSIVLMVVMVLSMSATAFAADLTINNTNTGETYSVYKIFDATTNSDKTGTTYYISTSSKYYDDVEESTIFNLVATGDTTVYQVTWEKTVTDDQLKAELVSYGAQGTVVETTIGNGGTITISSLDAGYYFVTTTTGTAVSIGNTGETTVIADKNREPVPTKTETTDGTAGIGDKVEYSVTIANAGDVTTLVYHDTMTSGLTFNDDVTIDDLTVTTDYTVSTTCTDGCTFEVSFTAEGLKKITDSVTITYSATINENAEDENYNTGKVTYGEGGQTSTETKTETKVYDFNLKKETSTGSKLDGAEFTLASGSDALAFVKVEGGYRLATSDEIKSTEIETTTKISAGSVNIFGLDANTYTLTETKAPNGYNQLTSTITIVINEDGSVNISDESDEDGSVTEKTVTVVNNSGTPLPSTGGIGTTIFYIVGGVLVLGAAVLFVTRKRLGSGN